MGKEVHDLRGWAFLWDLVDFTGNPLLPKPSDDKALMERSSEKGSLDFAENYLYVPYN